MMRMPGILIPTVAVVAGVALTIMATQATRAPPRPLFEVAQLAMPASEQASPSRKEGQSTAHPTSSPVSARMIAPEVVAPPVIDVQEVERVEARPPLGGLGLAAPPKIGSPDDWDGTLLYRPMVTSSASFEAMGYTIFIAGTEPVTVDATCKFDGVPWQCGERALLAFRYWLRGRAPLCQVLPTGERQPLVAPCRLGKQDVGAWLVSNGWALARPGGGYEEAELVARRAGMGIFGPPD